MDRNPFLLKSLRTNGTIKEVWLFTGSIPNAVSTALDSVIKQHNNAHKPSSNTVLHNFYGAGWESLLGLISGGSDIPDDIVGDIFDFKEPEPSLIVKNQPSSEVVDRPSTLNYNINRVAGSIYSEDRSKNKDIRHYRNITNVSTFIL